MNRYQERASFEDTYLCANEKQRKELLDYETANVCAQIIAVERKIDALGFSWFGEKKLQKREHKAELKKLRERLKCLRDLRDICNWRL